MKHLKFIFLVISFCLSAFFPFTHTAFAEQSSGYLRIITEDTPFYADAGGNNLLFYLPYTYYVKVLEESTFFTHVELSPQNGAAIDGYAPTEKLYFDGLAVSFSYPSLEITASRATAFYKDRTQNNVIQYVFENRTMRYYGELPLSTGGKLYFVGYNNRLGYVKEEDVLPFSLENHPNPLTFLPKEPENTEPAETSPQKETADATVLRIIIIACLSAAGIIALFIALRKKPQPHAAASYYDENDYE